MWKSLGKVTIGAAGTPVQVTTTRYGCQTVFFQQVSTNTGKLWICDRADAVKATGVGILAVIPAPTLTAGVATILPYCACTIPSAPGGLDASQFWIDVDNGQESCQVSAIRA